MLTRYVTFAVLGATLAAAPALAQTSSPSQSPAATMGAMNTSNWMTQEQPGQWRATKLEGLDVYNSNNEKIGDISELLVDNNGKVQAVVIGVGGFLGMGEHEVAVPFDQIKFVTEPRAVATTAPATTGSTTAPSGTTAAPNAPAATGSVTMNRSAPDHAMLMMNMTKEQLKAAPEFKFAR